MKCQAAGLLWLATGGPAFMNTKQALAQAAEPAVDVAIAKGDPAAAARASVNLLGGMRRFVKPGQKVVIKPNMSFANPPENATNTHPLVVRELLIMCKEAGASQVRILDHSLQDPEQSLIRSGIRDACDGVEPGLVHHLMQDKFYNQVEISQGVEMMRNGFMQEVMEADVLIAAPVAKSHGSTGVSLSLKGQMGLIIDRHIMHSRYDLDTSIIDMNTIVKPNLAVIDATRVLTTHGPSGPGKVITPGEVIASADPVAADATAVSSYEWYGRKILPTQVGHLLKASERGLGRLDLDKLHTKRVTV